jgi:hypothetical protein
VITNWKIRFTDGTETVHPAYTIAEAMAEAEKMFEKTVRSARFHSSFTDSQVEQEFGFGWGKLA